MKMRFLLGLMILFHTNMYAQCLVPSGVADSSFPVTNVYNTLYSTSARIHYNTGANIFNITAARGTYYLFGDFTHLSKNQGPALVIDSATNAVRTPQKWKVNGTVTSAIPDGNGGFFICGNFSKIGDSTRHYLAQINDRGQPTAWNPQPNNAVNVLYKKNDTLFIAGAFTTIFSRSKALLAIYSLSGDSLMQKTVTTGFFRGMSNIKSLLFQHDTLIYAGDCYSQYQSIGKYNVKDSVFLPWKLQIADYGKSDLLQFNPDSSVIIFQSIYNDQFVKGVSTVTGALKYEIGLFMDVISKNFGSALGLKVIGNKAYVAGYFEHVTPKSGVLLRKGFFSFDPSTGAISGDDLKADGYPTLLDSYHGKIFLSGKFSRVNSVNRDNFAVIDTGSLAVGSWQLSPTDPIVSMAFSNGKVFIGGHFNGINAIRRNGFAAIDSATKTILPWSPSNILCTEGKRMFVYGDTLFVLGITARPSSCMVNDFNTDFNIYSLTTGQKLSTGQVSYTKMYDCMIDGNYFYISSDAGIRRYSLPFLSADIGWGFNFGYDDPRPIYLIAGANKIYSVGDNRFVQQCTNLPERKGWFIEYDKNTGRPNHFYSYEGLNNIYDAITFDHALLVNEKLYVEGHFSVLNGQARRNFVALDVNTGMITDWTPNTGHTSPYSTFHRTSDLKLYNGKIWFGSAGFRDDRGKIFPGFGALDTSNGNMMPPLFYAAYNNEFSTKKGSFNDFIIHGNSFIGVGGFDYINGVQVCSIIKTDLKTTASPATTGIAITGPDTIYASGDSNKFYLGGANTSLNSYNWTYTGSDVSIINNGSDTVWLKVNSNSGSGNLVVRAVNYCGAAPLVQKTVVITIPPPTPIITGIVKKCRSASNGWGKLLNPPKVATIDVMRDGLQLVYYSADSSFQYFTSNITPAGTHTISVSYSNSNGVSQKDSVYDVIAGLTPAVSIATSPSSICAGAPVNFQATPFNGGSLPSYQWKVNGTNAGINSPEFTTNQLINGDQVNVILTSNASCITTPTANSNTINMQVTPLLIPTVTIAGITTVNTGQLITLTATPANGGTAPAYQWQDSTQSHTWQNISGVTFPTINYIPVKTGDKIRCLLTSNAVCAIPASVTSNSLSFTVNITTAIDPVPGNTLGIHLFPNPARDFMVIDTLRLQHKWQTLDIVSIDGRKPVAAYSIRNQARVTIAIGQLSSGIYIVVLKRKDGAPAFIKFAKQ